MKRRAFMLSVGGAAAGMVLLPRMALAEAGKIDWYTSSDQNILDFWTNVVKPKFEAANAGVTLNLVDGGDNAGLQAIAERAIAAMDTKTDPQADFFEGFDARQPVGAIDKGLWTDFAAAGLSNYSKINPLALSIDALPQNLPYRGSQVLLAFDTTKLAAADAPKTFADLIAWIKANPGQFIYNRPNKGGSGGTSSVAPFTRRTARIRRSSRSTTLPQKPLRPHSIRPGPCSTTSPRRCSTRAPIPQAIPSRSSSSASPR